MHSYSRNRLREAREGLRLNQREAAALIGFHPLTIARWETGEGGRIANSRLHIRLYCRALGQYAEALGLPAQEYRSHLLCPGEFPNPALLQAREDW